MDLQSIDRWHSFYRTCISAVGLILCAELVLPSLGFAADFRCMVDPPVIEMRAFDVYADRSASVVDPMKSAANDAAVKPVSIFAYHLAEATDARPMGAARANCAAQALRNWATAAALLNAKDPPSIRVLARYTIGFNLTVIKLRAAGFDVDPDVVRWLHDLSRAAVAGYPIKQGVANLDVWSGVNAASFLLLEPDAALKEHAITEWKLGVSQVASDGSLTSEMKRGKRALLYHQYYLSALLMLNEILPKVGYSPLDVEKAALRRLGKFVAAALCDPSSIKARTGLDQETPPPYQFAIVDAFGRDDVGTEWRTCVKLPETLRDAGSGGSMIVVREALKRLH